MQPNIRNDRLAARIDGEFVVFLIGMRINQPLQVQRWWPVAMAMPRMIRELYRHPELGFLHAETWGGRTTITVQYWRSMEQLLAYATQRDAEHLPAWRDFNRKVAATGAVGVWHESYLVSPGTYENVYVNMPAFGLGRAGMLFAATGSMHSASQRLRAAAQPPAGPPPAN
jgi:hypothetical protein